MAHHLVNMVERFRIFKILMQVIRKKWFKNRLHNAAYAYMVNMLVMGFWHGISVSYIAYGFYHGILMSGFEIYQKKKHFFIRNIKIKLGTS